ncbi:MAG: alpha-amylase [Deltaproteobacteria bacterium]|nr:alpha-amylase [Deltaproteobacteria bacterium]
MTKQSTYFPQAIQISVHHWRSLDLGALSRLIAERGIPPVIFYRQLAMKLNRRRPPGLPPVHAGQLNLYATLLDVYRYIIDALAEADSPGVLTDALRRGGFDPAGREAVLASERFVELFPPDEVLAGQADTASWLGRSEMIAERRRTVLRELLLLRMAAENPAIDGFREILDDRGLAASSPYPRLVAGMASALEHGPRLPGLDMTLVEALRAPITASPASLSGQLGFIRDHWNALLPPELLEELAGAFDILLEEEREWGGGGEPGPPPVMEFGRAGQLGAGGAGGGSSVFAGYDYPEYEGFSADADWMSNVVMMAKMVYVWLDQLSRQHGRPIERLDQIPDTELDQLASWGFSGLWLIGIWERSPASQRIKQLCGNPDAIASAYSLFDYEIASDLGGWEALGNLRERAARRGIRLASDMVPNHTGIYSRWVIQHPDWFVQTDYPPFPGYRFTGEDLSHSADTCIQIEDGYWTRSDAAVVFRHHDRRDGRTRYIYHGNDGTSFPWNDTAQLNYLIPEVREAVIQTILHVARNFPIIRFDAAMTLAKKHYQRLWFPVRGLGGGIPSRSEQGMSREEFDAVFPVEFWREVVDRVAAEAPGTLLLAEAFWLMEGYFVRTLGMHRVYNSAFMNMLKTEENAKYRQTIANVLEFNPEVLKRFVNFMNNPDEKTAVEQFGAQGKYFGACVLLATMPGLPMFGHGQIEGYREKYGMEYKRAYWDEQVDEGLVRGHEMWIFPLLRRRGLFSGSENFVLYDFHAGGAVDENVFAYSNRVGDQRAVVLYHNRHAVTAGWIRGSVAFAVKARDGEQELCRTTLAEALGFAGDAGSYHAFRDVTSGLEYVRSGGELREKGLYAELGEYEFHIFLDFREIRDDRDGDWSRLCAALNGRGAESLDDELKQLRYASLNEAFRAVLALAPVSDTDALTAMAGTTDEVVQAAQRFLAVLNAQPAPSPDLPLPERVPARQGEGRGVDVDGRLAGISACLPFFRAVAQSRPASKGARAFRTRMTGLLASPAGARLLLAWLLLKDTGVEPAAFGLDTSLKRMLTGAEGLLAPADAGRCVHLLGALLAACGAAGKKGVTALEKVFAADACRLFMLVHEDSGVEWFNKERFEELTQWLAVCALAEMAPGRPAARTVAAWMAAMERDLVRHAELAAHAGYRTGLFLRLLQPAAKGAEGARTQKGGGEGTDVQGGA